MKYFESLIIVVLFATTIAACYGDTETKVIQDELQTTQNRMQDENSVAGIASNHQDLSIMVNALESTGSVPMLSDSSKSFTVFAPTDSAFEALPDGKLDSLMMENRKDELRNVLAYHVVEDSVMMAADLKDGQTFTSAQGAELTVTEENGNILINGAKIVKSNIKASNGVIHVVNKVIIPQDNEL